MGREILGATLTANDKHSGSNTRKTLACAHRKGCWEEAAGAKAASNSISTAGGSTEATTGVSTEATTGVSGKGTPGGSTEGEGTGACTTTGSSTKGEGTGAGATMCTARHTQERGPTTEENGTATKACCNSSTRFARPVSGDPTATSAASPTAATCASTHEETSLGFAAKGDSRTMQGSSFTYSNPKGKGSQGHIREPFGERTCSSGRAAGEQAGSGASNEGEEGAGQTRSS